MNTINTAIYDQAVDRAAMVRLYEKGAHNKIDDVLALHSHRVDALLKNRSNLTDSSFKADLDLELATTYNIAHNTSKRSMLDLLASQISYMYQNLEATIGKVWNVAKPDRRIAEEIVLARPLQGDVTLLRGWANVSGSERARLSGVIREGLAAGHSESEIALAIRKGNVFNISRNQSHGLVTTALTSISSQADHEVYKANEKALVGYQFIAVLDSRTTPICAHNDGKVFRIGDVAHLPPLHWYCRSTTIPVVKKYDDLASLEGVAQIRKTNLEKLTPKEKAYYDGIGPLKESYDEWLRRQSQAVQLRHIGDLDKLKLFQSNQLTLDKFTNDSGRSISIGQLKVMSDTNEIVPGQTARFARAKEQLDTIKLGANRPDDILNNESIQKALKEYYLLQAGELDGTLSTTNYRGITLGSKKATKTRVLASPPTDDNLKFNPITGRYEDARLFQPSPAALDNSLRLMDLSEELLERDKKFIRKFSDDLDLSMSVNQRAVIVDNLRATFSRARSNPEPWVNLKAVLNGQMKFDVMNISDFMETQLRRDQNLLKRLNQENYFDPVLGEVQLQELHDNFISNIFKRNAWEDKMIPKLGRELRGGIPFFHLDTDIPLLIRNRLDEKEITKFYERFAGRLSLADGPDRDQMAMALGRDLYNSANFRGQRRDWYNLGLKLLNKAESKGFFKQATFGVQKRRLKSRLGNHYIGPYYDTYSIYLQIVDPRIIEYSKLVRKVDVGQRLGVTTGKNRLMIRKGYKTYFDRFYRDTRIPITSHDSFPNFPTDIVDRKMEQALNWAAQAEYKIEPTFHDFIEKLLNFQDDKGKAQYYNDLNHYREHIIGRGDAYERFKAMKWLRTTEKSFSNHPYLDSRARLYERGMIGPQSGETFRPFLSTKESKALGQDGFENLQDTIGATLSGLSDHLEGDYNGLSQIGRQQVALKWRKDMIELGSYITSAKPNDIRKVLENTFLSHIDGEEQGKVLRLSLETYRIDTFLKGNYGNLSRLNEYLTDLALEQDASSSGAQIIALTTKNRQLAELSNVVPTDQKQRLYDEIAAATFQDPRFRELNKKLGLTEKDLRKAAKAQNMVTFYGAGQKTGILNVERKLAGVLGKDTDTLVVTAKQRDLVLNEIAARAERYRKYDPEMFNELKALQADVRDVFNKGEDPGLEIMRQLYFLDPKTKEFVEKLTNNYVNIVTPQDFSDIAKIMSEELAIQVPILKDFTKYFGRLAREYSETTGNLDIPWKTFDGKTIEQHFPLSFEERLVYKTKDGEWVTNFIQAAQKTDPSFLDQVLDKDGKIHDIADTQKATTAFAVNGNHSNDAVIVRKFHIWGRANDINTGTIHDAFFTNISDMLNAKGALRGIYGDLVETTPIEATLKEMRSRGLSWKLYFQYLNEAKDIGLIPVEGRSVVGGRVITKKDILTKEDIMTPIPVGFRSNKGWYGIGP